jgi:hypothetical protein
MEQKEFLLQIEIFLQLTAFLVMEFFRIFVFILFVFYSMKLEMLKIIQMGVKSY